MSRWATHRSGTVWEARPPARRGRRPSSHNRYLDDQTVATPPIPSAAAVFWFRSHSRPATNGPRSSTVAVTRRPLYTNVTLVPHGSDLLATPMPAWKPQAVPPPSLYHDATLCR